MDFVVILLTALFTSIFTLTGAWLLYRFVIEREVDKAIDEAAAEFEQRLTESFEKAVDEAAPEFRKELEQGFRDAAEALIPDFSKAMQEGFHEAGGELLPEMRAEVREGFKDGVVDIATGEIVPAAAKRSAGILEAGLNLFLGPTKDKDSEK